MCSAEHLKQYRCFDAAIQAGVRVNENFEKIKVIKNVLTQKQNCSANCSATHRTKSISAVPPVLVPGDTLFIRVVQNLCISNAKVFHFISQQCVSVLHVWCSGTVLHTADHIHEAASREVVIVPRGSK